MKFKKILLSLTCAFSFAMAFNFTAAAKAESKVTEQQVLNKREEVKNFEINNKNITKGTFMPLEDALYVFGKDERYKNLIKSVFLNNNRDGSNYAKEDIEKFKDLFKNKMLEIYGSLYNEKTKKEYNEWLKKAINSWKNVGENAPNKEMQKLTKEQRKEKVKQDVKEMEKELNYYFGEQFVSFIMRMKYGQEIENFTIKYKKSLQELDEKLIKDLRKKLDKEEMNALKLAEALKVLNILTEREQEAKKVLKKLDTKYILECLAND